MLTLILAALLAAPPAQSAAAQAAGRRAPSPLAPSEIVAAAPKGDWVAIAAADLLVMELAPDAARRPRRVVIQLMPAPFSQGWIGNIRKLAAAKWWDGTSVNRVQDNYVVQWGDASEKKELPAGLGDVPESEYVSPIDPMLLKEIGAGRRAYGDARPMVSVSRDTYADGANFERGWPLAYSWIDRAERSSRWPVHCYGMVGVGRDLPPNTGTGAELYTVIGHAPRHLDRNIALVGRVIEGIEHLSSLPRGTQALGFYKTAAERTPIVSIRMATDLPAAQQPRFEYLSTESDSFARYADARANRRDDFFIRPAGGADICNVPVPVRAVE